MEELTTPNRLVLLAILPVRHAMVLAHLPVSPVTQIDSSITLLLVVAAQRAPTLILSLPAPPATRIAIPAKQQPRTA